MDYVHECELSLPYSWDTHQLHRKGNDAYLIVSIILSITNEKRSRFCFFDWGGDLA